ncbi:MAG: pyruvate ferredoxin oxidoreductase subunit gamma [Nitrospirales bacterium]|nr:MAG: pyruvate ferredoxin oxidoreductase subunit gamma [Nitrospirales bacterium]
MMFHIRIHGRGGQGVVTAAELLSIAAFFDGKYAQAFPSFGSERMGAPVTAYCRIGHVEIRSREPVSHPNIVIIQDSTLLLHVDVFSGLSKTGYVLINSARTLEALQVAEFCSTLPEGHCCVIPVSEIAIRHLGRPLVNTGLVAGFAKLTGALSKESVERAIKQKFPGYIGDVNTQIVAKVYEQNIEPTLLV